MKRYIIKLLFLLVLMSFASCESFLDVQTKSEFAEDVVFSKPELTDGVITGIYKAFGEDRSYRNRLVAHMGVNTDIEKHSNGPSVTTSTNDRSAIAVYQITAAQADGWNDADAKDPWSRIYTAVEQCNLAVAGIRTYGSPAAGNTMGQYLGEALTLRAFFYFELIKYWGDVPARFEPTNSGNIYLPRTKREEIYTQILSDLQEAITFLPWAGDAANLQTVERVSKGFAKGLRARIALSAAGYAQCPIGTAGVVKETNAGSVIVRTASDERKAELYTIARDECLDIMNSQKHHLSGSFEQLFRDISDDVVTIGRDPIFEIPFSNSRGQIMNYFGLRHDNADKYCTTAGASKGEVGVNATFFYDFNVKDKRRDVTIVPYRWIDGKQELKDITTLYLGKLRAEWRTNKQITSNDDGVNFCVLRYTDVLLMFAEAENELNNGPVDAAKNALKEVRNRAFDVADRAVEVEDYVNGLTTRDAFFNAIVNERAFEFAGENIRKQDLIRWGMLKEKMDETKAKYIQLRNRTAPYDLVPEYIYTKRANDGESLTIFGLNPGETEDKAANDVTWTKVQWTTALSAGVIRLSDDWINKAVYVGNPNERQLFPIMNIIVTNSGGKLSNDYGY